MYEPLPTRSCQASVKLAPDHWSGFHSGIGDRKIGSSFPAATARTTKNGRTKRARSQIAPGAARMAHSHRGLLFSDSRFLARPLRVGGADDLSPPAMPVRYRPPENWFQAACHWEATAGESSSSLTPLRKYEGSTTVDMRLGGRIC